MRQAGTIGTMIAALCLALALPLLAGAGCETNKATGRKQLIIISETQEIALGRQAAPGVENEIGKPSKDNGLQARVQAIGKEMCRTSQRPTLPYTFTVLESKVPNAFSLPGGPVYITTGLIRLLETSPDRIAAVLGHEIGHINARHAVSQMQTTLGLELLLQAANVGTNAEDRTLATGRVVGALALLKFSRDDELEADRLGMDYLVATKRRPEAMLEVLQKLQTLEQDQPNLMSELTRTHPHSAIRVDEARKYIGDRRAKGRYPAR